MLCENLQQVFHSQFPQRHRRLLSHGRLCSFKLKVIANFEKTYFVVVVVIVLVLVLVAAVAVLLLLLFLLLIIIITIIPITTTTTTIIIWNLG